MNPRIAMKEAIRFILVNIGTDEDVATVVSEKMHDDPTFLEELEGFFQEHIADFGENYGL